MRVGLRHGPLGLRGRPSDIHGMTSSPSTIAWLPAAIARAAVLPPSTPTVRARGRHAAPEAPGLFEIVAAEQVRPGRHAEPEWSRDMFDAGRDEDPFEWLGFGA